MNKQKKKDFKLDLSCILDKSKSISEVLDDLINQCKAEEVRRVMQHLKNRKQ